MICSRNYELLAYLTSKLFQWPQLLGYFPPIQKVWLNKRTEQRREKENKVADPDRASCNSEKASAFSQCKTCQQQLGPSKLQKYPYHTHRLCKLKSRVPGILPKVHKALLQTNFGAFLPNTLKTKK